MTPVRYYRTMERKDAVMEFAGFELNINIRALNIYNKLGTDSFRVWIATRYADLAGLEKDPDVDSLDMISIDSLCLVLGKTVEKLCPALDSSTLGGYFLVRGKDLFGPTFNYERVVIKPENDSIEISFVAYLKDRKTGAEILRQEFRQTLYRLELRDRFI